MPAVERRGDASSSRKDTGCICLHVREQGLHMPAINPSLIATFTSSAELAFNHVVGQKKPGERQGNMEPKSVLVLGNVQGGACQKDVEDKLTWISLAELVTS